MINALLILLGKLFSMIIRFTNVGSGSTWPGHVALTVNKNFIKAVVGKNPNLKIILIAGTNGKTTTGKLIQTILEKANYRAFQNESGANLLNGIVSSMLLRSNILCKINYNFAIFEIDEYTLPLILKEITPDYVILLNLFRDQLDRYGEVNSISKKWGDALKKLSKKTKLILNADDPQIASLKLHMEGVKLKQLLFFGLDDEKLANKNPQHASDSTYCSNCGERLSYSSVFYSHLGIWKCLSCKNSRPKIDYAHSPFFPLVGIYNKYNTIAAVSLAILLNIKEKYIYSALEEFKPAFGRQEKLTIDGKKVQIFLSKNPTGFNESLRTIVSLNAKNLLIVLNDRIPDGRDISWIWDVDFEDYINKFKNTTVSGDRVYDMALRIKYAVQTQILNQNYSPRESSGEAGSSKFETFEDLEYAIRQGLKTIDQKEILYILPTYSAMLEIRKILTGKKIP